MSSSHPQSTTSKPLYPTSTPNSEPISHDLQTTPPETSLPAAVHPDDAFPPASSAHTTVPARDSSSSKPNKHRHKGNHSPDYYLATHYYPYYPYTYDSNFAGLNEQFDDYSMSDSSSSSSSSSSSPSSSSSSSSSSKSSSSSASRSLPYPQTQYPELY